MLRLTAGLPLLLIYTVSDKLVEVIAVFRPRATQRERGGVDFGVSVRADTTGLPVPHRLAGRLILLIEDEPLVALDVEKALRAAGAKVISAGYVESGLYTTEHPDLSAAVVDLHLGKTGDGTTVCRRLRQLGVPFVVYTGYPAVLVTSEWPDVPVISKPADPKQIIESLVRLLV